MIAVQMGVDKKIKRAVAQNCFDQGQGLARMRAIATVDQRGFFAIGEQNIVRRQPTAFENMHSGG